MTPEYEKFVASRFKVMDFNSDELMHAAVGISGEAGELLDAVKKYWAYGANLDVENVYEELGDILFYMQAMLNTVRAMGCPTKTMQELIDMNTEKLTKRYPSGYSNADAIARKDKQ